MDRLLEATFRAERDHFWFRGFRRFVSPLLAQASQGRSDLRLIDCGCGTGNNLRLLQPYGQAFGFDLTKSGLAYARGSGLEPVAQASVAAIPFPSAAFDIVTSFDVLICLPEPVERAALGEMWRVLKPGGSSRTPRTSGLPRGAVEVHARGAVSVDGDGSGSATDGGPGA